LNKPITGIFRVSTANILDELGYDFYSFTTPPEKPEYSQLKFKDIIPKFLESDSPKCRGLATNNLYIHQEQAFQELKNRKNIILRSGTGSGKTEAWFIYTATSNVKTLVVYPTLALANDQLNRLREYTNTLGMKIIALDALKKNELLKTRSLRELRQEITKADLVITNPAFLLNELKKTATGKQGLLYPFLEKSGLIVVDDFDFYGPRSIALLFSMIKLIIQTINTKIQLAFITAALENAEEIAEFLTGINGYETAIIEGKAFHPENITYIVLGKSLRKTWEELKIHYNKFRESGVSQDILESLRDYQKFKQDYFKVMDVARIIGIQIPDEAFDVAEILSRYVSDNCISLIFTRGIAAAEEMAKRVSTKLSDDRFVVAHHHLLSKTQREKIEERARNGEIKVIISPRTLSQGIDIGLVGRVVHLGLPDSIREFKQREGRKGRRLEIERTETVIIPRTLWDRDLLSRGVEAVKKWIELPSERIMANKNNLYIKLFETLFRFISPNLRSTLSKEDYEFLEKMGLVRDGDLTYLGKNTWLKMNFYEFAPAYGIKRLRVTEMERIERLEDISHVDLVEKFQIGCIDYSSDGVVVEHRRGGKRKRIVTAVVVDDLSERIMQQHDALAYVLEEYEKTKARWGEIPSIRRDYYNGKIHSEVRCVVHAPSKGFGLYQKIPNRVEWIILSDRKRIEAIGDRTLVYRERKTLEVPTPTNGIYNDYTYGISFEADPRDSTGMLRIGLAYLIVMLRRILGVAFDTIKYDIMVMGERKVIGIHETESAGLLEKINWTELAEMIRRYTPDNLDEVFMEEVDEIAYSDLIALKIDWRLVKNQTLKIIDYIRLNERIAVKIGGLEVEIPRPSRANKLVSLSIVDITLREDLRYGIYAIALYDGEETLKVIGRKEFGEPDEQAGEVMGKLSKLVNQNFKILVYDYETLDKMLLSTGLHALRAFLHGLKGINAVIDVKNILSSYIGESIPLEEVEKTLQLEKSINLKDLIFHVEELKRRRGINLQFAYEKLYYTLEKFIHNESENIYRAFLVLQVLKNRQEILRK